MLDKHMLRPHIHSMVEVLGSAEFESWFQALDDSDTDAVARVVDMLELQGPTLPFPRRMVPRAERIWERYLLEIGR